MLGAPACGSGARGPTRGAAPLERLESPPEVAGRDVPVQLFADERPGQSAGIRAEDAEDDVRQAGGTVTVRCPGCETVSTFEAKPGQTTHGGVSHEPGCQTMAAIEKAERRQRIETAWKRRFGGRRPS